MATLENIYEAPFWENNTDEPLKPFVNFFLCPLRVTDPVESSCEAEICFSVSHDWESILTFLSSTTIS